MISKRRSSSNPCSAVGEAPKQKQQKNQKHRLKRSYRLHCQSRFHPRHQIGSPAPPRVSPECWRMWLRNKKQKQNRTRNQLVPGRWQVVAKVGFPSGCRVATGIGCVRKILLFVELRCPSCSSAFDTGGPRMQTLISLELLSLPQAPVTFQC